MTACHARFNLKGFSSRAVRRHLVEIHGTLDLRALQRLAPRGLA